MKTTKDDLALGRLLRTLLAERSLSMRQFSKLAELDIATISRIINGKRKANLQHLERFSDSLDIPLSRLMTAAGYEVDLTEEELATDLHASIEVIQDFLETDEKFTRSFSAEQVEEKLEQYQLYSQTEEGARTIRQGFAEKLKSVGSVGPFISELKRFHKRFIAGNGTAFELALIGGVLLYFITPVDVIPDFLFPVGYLDDAIAVQLTSGILAKRG